MFELSCSEKKYSMVGCSWTVEKCGLGVAVRKGGDLLGVMLRRWSRGGWSGAMEMGGSKEMRVGRSVLASTNRFFSYFCSC